jgi:hypothetical protein
MYADRSRKYKSARNRSPRTLKVLLAIFLMVVTTPAVNSQPVLAETNCREVARNVQVEAASAGNGQPTESAEAFVEEFRQAAVDYPECEPELRRLWEWNASADPSTPFPFGKSDDPKNYRLGPISWWWDTLYNGLFGGSTVLMLLFGWELFLAPFPIILSLLLTPFSVARDRLRSRRRKLP